MFAFGTKTVLHAVIEIVDVGLGIEASESTKPVAAVGVVHEVIQFPAFALQCDLGRRAGEIGPEGAATVSRVAAQALNSPLPEKRPPSWN